MGLIHSSNYWATPRNYGVEYGLENIFGTILGTYIFIKLYKYEFQYKQKYEAYVLNRVNIDSCMYRYTQLFS